MDKLTELELNGLRRIADYTNQDFLDYLTAEEIEEYNGLISNE
jgi:hypothetical protein